jgi:peptidoglycan/LPS O-acetylase OafA/YrhL
VTGSPGRLIPADGRNLPHTAAKVRKQVINGYRCRVPPSSVPAPVVPAHPPDRAVPPVPAGPPGPPRLGWLDALRAIAALMVAFQHAGYRYVPKLQWEIAQWFDPGTYGITVFFLVSGYIVPASLTRTGDVRRFWISRLFRIYPLWAFASAVIVVLAVTDVAEWRQGLPDVAPGTAVLAHLTMLQDLLFVPSVINVLWTLSYEMAFYLIVVALFTTRMHTRPAPVAACFAMGAVLLGSLLPVAGLSRAADVDLVVAIVAACAACAIGGAMSGHRAVRTAGALLGGVLGLALVTLNGRVGPWQGLAIMGAMFTGTAVHQAERGLAGRRVAGRRVAGLGVAGRGRTGRGAVALVAAWVLLCSVVAGVWHSRTWGLPPAAEVAFQRAWTSAMVAAALTFAVGLAVRHRKLPRALTGIGLISYSIYLLHPVLFQSLDHLIGRPGNDNGWALIGALAGLLLVSWVAYRLIEAPTQRLGRTLARRWSTTGRRSAPA